MLTEIAQNNVNNLIIELEKELLLPKTSFTCGEIFASTSQKASLLCPYSKMAVLFSKTFLTNGEKINQALKEQNLEMISIVVDENANDKDEIIASLPENVRLVLTFENELNFLAQEIATKLNLECVIGLLSLPDKLFCEQGLAPTHFVLSTELQFSIADIYENIVSKIISLLDIKLKQFLKIIYRHDLFLDEFINILQTALLILDRNDKKLAQTILECDIALQLIERAFLQFSPNCDLKTSLAILNLVANSLDKEFLSVPNYVERAKKVSELYNLDYYKTLKAFSYQIEAFNSIKNNLVDVKRGLKELASIYYNLAPKIVSTFSALGGKCLCSIKELKNSVFYRSDIEYYNNIVSLLRENGCLEQIM